MHLNLLIQGLTIHLRQNNLESGHVILEFFDLSYHSPIVMAIKIGNNPKTPVY